MFHYCFRPNCGFAAADGSVTGRPIVLLIRGLIACNHATNAPEDEKQAAIPGNTCIPMRPVGGRVIV